MTLDDLTDNPTLIAVNLQITGPNGAAPNGGGISVDSRVVIGKKSDTVHTETVQWGRNAVVAAHVAVGGLVGKTQKIEVAAQGEPNCYWLPWASGRVYTGTLGNDHRLFFTYTINGCGFIIGGTTAQPFVAHANLESDRLTQAAIDGMKHGKNAGAVTASNQAIIYDQFYGNLAAKLVHNDVMSGVRLHVVTPQEYLIDAGAGFGAVFGVNTGGSWTLYGNWANTTKKIWPRQ